MALAAADPREPPFEYRQSPLDRLSSRKVEEKSPDGPFVAKVRESGANFPQIRSLTHSPGIIIIMCV